MKTVEIDIPAVLSASIQSCLQVILLCIAGYISAKYEVITLKSEEGLSKLIIYVLMPCLLFANIGCEIDFMLFVELWPILFFFVIFFIISGLLGLFGGAILRLSKAKTKFIITGIMFNNVTTLSLGLLRGMQNTKIMEILSWGEDDSPSEAVKRGTTYILIATLFGNLLRWSLGTYLLRSDENEDEDLIISNSENDNNDSKNKSATIIISSSSLENVTIANERTPLIINHDSLKRSSPKNIFSRVIPKASINLYKINKIMNPPLYAALIALFVGLIPPIKAIFFGNDSPVYLTVTQTMEYLGSMAIPLTLITLGAQLRNLPRTKCQEMLFAINYVMICRFLIMPIIGIVTILLTRSWYISDPMFWFVLMLLACGPSAVNCMNLTQLTGTFQEEMATLLFYSYIAVVPMITILLMAILTIISKVASE